jgi:hypothetical protein
VPAAAERETAAAPADEPEAAEEPRLTTVCEARQGRRAGRLQFGRPAVSQRDTEHLRILIANERKHRLALVASIVVALGKR